MGLTNTRLTMGSGWGRELVNFKIQKKTIQNETHREKDKNQTEHQ